MLLLMQKSCVCQYAESDEDHDGGVDTDEEVSNGKVNILNGNGPPYFHSYLYMKGKETNIRHTRDNPEIFHMYKYCCDVCSWFDDPVAQALVCS